MTLRGHDVINIIEVHIVSLKARMEKAKEFPLNTNMHVEAELCKAQIEALLKEADSWRK